MITSPELPAESGIVKTRKEFSDALTVDLTDDEIQRALQITIPIKNKWQNRFRLKYAEPNFNVDEAMKLIDQFEDEIKYELATKLDLLVRVDSTPVLEGQPMIIEFMGALPSHSTAKYGLDHDKKTSEVRTATDRKEGYLGEKEPVNKTKAKKRNKNQ